jgi:cytidine deaminase
MTSTNKSTATRELREFKPLFDRACANRERSYSRYSSFPVGAVVRTSDGRIFDGCNVENGSFGLTLCAERAALSAAVLGGLAHNGDITVTELVVAGPDGVSCSPCGACRQWIQELASNAVVAFWWQNELRTANPTDLAPFGFQYDG